MVFKPLNLHVYSMILVVQENSDCPILETGLSGFHLFKPLDRNYHFIIFLTSLSLKNNREGDPKTLIGNPLVPLWNLGVLGRNQLPKNHCLRFPNRVFLISRYFHLILDLFAPWMNLNFLWCIVFIHVIDQFAAISLSFLG
jgi:hypothetical protein